ncbi:MAG: GIY-YIG nuclease family protein [bacterium]
MKIIGIYKITNTLNGLLYIGSSKDIKDRWFEHKFKLRRNVHSSKYLQEDWNRYGENIFTFEIIEECSKNNKLQREQYWLDFYKSYERDKGYNIEFKTDKTVRSDYVIEKIRKTLLGRIPVNKGKKGLQIAWNKGQTKETNLIMAKLAQGWSKTKKGMISPFKGKYHTEEAKEKNRQAHLNEVHL